MAETVAEYIASYASSLRFEDLPPEVVGKTKGLLIDSLGCALRAYASEPAKIARRIAGRVLECDLPATVIGSGQKTLPELATFANGVMIRYLDLNDTLRTVGGGHPSDNFAPVITCADAVHASGKEVIVGAVLAYEVMCRWNDQMTVLAHGFDHCVPGVVAGAVSAARVLGLTRGQMVHTIGLALAPNMSLAQTRVGEVSMWKGCAMPNAGRNAVFAALLAREGLTGPSPIYEGRYGLFNVTGPFQMGPFGGEGRPFRILDSSIKRYPCGNLAQTAIDAAIELRSKVGSVADIAAVNIQTFSHARDTMAGDEEKWHPNTRETADHSMPYVVAVALTHGTLDVKHFDDEFVHDPAIHALMQKIKVEVTDECNRLHPAAHPVNMELVSRDGKKFTVKKLHWLGHHRTPLSDEEITRKFTGLSRDVLTPEQRRELLDLAWNLEQADDAARLVQLTRI